MISLFAVFLILVAGIGFYWHGKQKYWQRQRIDGPSPIPIAGNMLNYLLMRKHYGEVYDDIYRAYPGAAYVGVYKLMNQPSILVRDLDLVRDVMVEHFNHFQDNDFILDENVDPLFSKDPFAATGKVWKDGRIHLAPLFTASKVKGVFPLINEVCNNFVKFIDKYPHNVDAKSLCTKYTLETVGSIAFGIDAKTFTDSETGFKQMVDKLFAPDKWSLLKTTTFLFLPFLSKLLQMPFVSKEIDLWIRNMIKEVVQRRSVASERRNDFLQALIDLRSKTDISDDLLCGYSATILIEGFETSGSLMAFCLYELAVNQDIQEMARQEVDEMFRKYNDHMTDEGIQELAYLDGIMYETLRLYPPMLALTKVCTKTFKLSPQYSDSKDAATVEPGTPILVPVYAIHHDPDHYSEPAKFDPTRFIGEKRKNLKKYSFLSFGEGPRMWLGQRFGLTQSKAGIASILKHFIVKLMPNTPQPLPISKTTFVLACDEGIWISFEKR